LFFCFLVYSENKADAKLTKELARVYAELEACDADKAPSRAAKILSGLGFSTEDQKKKTK
jgi:ATPase subunit of ABC transporter with duplicated ATPase domains